MRKLTKADLQVPALLIALSLVPTLGGIARLANLSGGAAGPEDARFLAAPAPVVLHVIVATLFSVLGAFQFSAGFRLRWPGAHRRAGKLLGLCGLVAGATGLWMTAVYPIPRELQGPLLYVVRLLVGSAMIGAILVAWRAILRRDVPRHEAFMIRAYALGQGAGTQAFILGPWMLITGESGGLTRDLLMTLAWLLNVAVAEFILRRARPARPEPTSGRGSARVNFVQDGRSAFHQRDALPPALPWSPGSAIGNRHWRAYVACGRSDQYSSSPREEQAAMTVAQQQAAAGAVGAERVHLSASAIPPNAGFARS